MIVNAQVADDVLFIFRELFMREYQIRQMHLIEIIITRLLFIGNNRKISQYKGKTEM